MGVIKGSKELFGYRAGDDLEHIEPELSSTSEDEHSIVAEAASRRRVAARPPPSHGDLHLTEAIAKRRKGAKQARRCDNLRELINMVEREDLELDFNIFEPTTSVFAELLTERKKMEVWNEFVNSSEEEQMELLQCPRSARQPDCCPGSSDASMEDTSNNNGSNINISSSNNGNGLDDSWEHISEGDVQDKRSAHPGFSAEQCFLRLDKNIRTVLKRRQRPMGMLMSLEQDLISFFHEWPTSVYVSKLSSSYERMMLHALSQYLDLCSRSYDCGDIRQTHVENPNSLFVAPPVLLTQYLDQCLENSTPSS